MATKAAPYVSGDRESSLEEAEGEDELEMDIEDQPVAEMKSRGPQKNVSTFAFTATPKEKTGVLLRWTERSRHPVDDASPEEDV